MAATLTEAVARAQLENWAGEQKWPVQRADANAIVTLPLTSEPELAGQAWVTRIGSMERRDQRGDKVPPNQPENSTDSHTGMLEPDAINNLHAMFDFSGDQSLKLEV